MPLVDVAGGDELGSVGVERFEGSIGDVGLIDGIRAATDLMTIPRTT